MKLINYMASKEPPYTETLLCTLIMYACIHADVYDDDDAQKKAFFE